MKKSSALFLLLAISESTWAATSACENHFVKFENHQLQTAQRSEGNCILAIGQRYTPGLIYRDFIFTSDGQLMVFNSYGDGPTRTHTGARVFYFAPRVNDLAFDVVGDDVVVHLPNGSQMHFNLTQGKFQRIDDAIVQEDDNVTRDNFGGLEILNYSKTYFNMGFQMGNSPVMNSSGHIQIKQASGDCQARMSDVFKYRDGEAYFQLFDPQDLNNFLREKCGHSFSQGNKADEELTSACKK